MKALDTNVLIRFLIKDDNAQAQAVYTKFKQAEDDKEVLVVPLLVVLEIIWVLESVYEIHREEIIESIDSLIMMPILEFESLPVIRQFIFSARQNNMDLSDLLIASSAKQYGCESVLTFDKKASSFEGFELVG